MINYQIYPEQNFLFVAFHGKVTSEELDNYVNERLNMEFEDNKVMALVVFCANSKADEISYNDIMSAGLNLKTLTLHKESLTAIVAKTTLGYALAKIYKGMTEITMQDTTMVFKKGDIKKAVKWLGTEHLSSDIEALINQYESQVT